MKILQLLLIISSLFLQACQYNDELSALKLSDKKQQDASNYNILLGMGYLKQGDAPRAKAKLLKALELTPNSPEANASLAYYFEKTDDLKDAGIYYQKALNLAPKSGSQLNNYGAFLCRIGQYAKADAYFLKAIKDVNYLNTAAAYENAGLCAAAIPNEKQAEAYFIKALNQDSRRRQSLFELAALKMKQSKPEVALSYLQKYRNLTLASKPLLNLGLKAAKKTKNFELETEYQKHINRIKNPE